MAHSHSESDNYSSSDEIESELYSVLHYNATDDFPPEILEKYDIRRNGDEISISLKKKQPYVSESRKPIPLTTGENSSVGSNVKENGTSISTVETLSLNKNHKSPQTSLDSSVSDTESVDKPVCVKKGSSQSSKVNNCIDVVVIHDTDSDSDVIIEEPVIPVTTVSSSDSEVCVLNASEDSSLSDSEISTVNDSGVNDTMFLNISNRSTTMFPEDSGAEEEVIDVDWRSVASPSTWSDSMKKYYNKPCKRLKEFDYRKILQEMKGRGDWFINSDDMFPNHRKHYRRCSLCRQTDHLINNCPKRFSNCAMCGNMGHVATNCPYRMCLNCGKRNNMFVAMCQRCEMARNQICDECKQVGHLKSNCPDTWRRFNLTVKGELVSRPDTVSERLLCCNCGKRGHLFENCKSLYWSHYPPTSFLTINKTSLKVPIGNRHSDSNNSFRRSPKRARWNSKRNNNHSMQSLETPKRKKRKTPKNKKRLNCTI